MREIPPSEQREVIGVGDDYEVYREPYKDGWTMVFKMEDSMGTVKVYPDGTRVYLRPDGSQLTYFPEGGIFVLDRPGEPTISDDTVFKNIPKQY